jgi:PAS domain-containing protein
MEKSDETWIGKTAEERIREKYLVESKDFSEFEVMELIHELGVHQIELENQNEELRQAKEAIETGLEKYTALYNFSPVGYFTLDKTGMIIECNLSGAKMLNIARSNLVKLMFLQFVDKDYSNNYLFI